MDTTKRTDEFSDDLETDDYAQDEYYDDTLAEDAGDEGYADDSWDEYEDDVLAADNRAAASGKGKDGTKPKSKISNNVIIAGAVVVGVAVMLFQMAKGPSKNAPQNAPTQQTASTPAAPDADTSVAPTQMDIIYRDDKSSTLKQAQGGQNNGKSGFMNDPSTLTDVEKIRETMTFEDFNTDSSSETLPPSQTAPREVTDAPPMPAPIVPAQDEVLTPLPDEILTAETPVKESPVKTPSKAGGLIEQETPAPASDSRAADKLDMIADKLVALEKNVGALTAASIDRDDLSAIQKSVKALETRLAALETQPRSQETAAPAPRRAETDTPKKAAVKKQPVRKAATQTPPKSRTNWVLKSAQPGFAMVTQAGQDDLRTVTIGDSLAGVGEITAIYADQGRWIVQGTTGQVAQ